jgi:hypothetical protein
MHADTKRLLHASLGPFRHTHGIHVVRNEHVERGRSALIDDTVALDDTKNARMATEMTCASSINVTWPPGRV